ncbi:hypothetical protein BGZ76_004405 [Entomortierella beljakovae]|nr:hypothetical protein BGZ76_004405 [Entomortierella beljakovae]
MIQTWIYKKDPIQTVSIPARIFIVTTFIAASTLVGQIFFNLKEWIDVLYYLSYIKLIISFIKYCPQAYVNYLAKSTVGWSIHNILLDFTGGALSISQLVLDAYISGDWSGISGDLVKFGLGFLSIAFDLVFITQHYILYRDRTDHYIESNKDISRDESSSSSSSQDSEEEEEEEERRGLLTGGNRKKYNTEIIDDRNLENSIEEARKVRQEEWKKAYDNKENPPPVQEEEPYDPRTLYERLQEQKQKKDDAFAEATKFGNLIHRIDNDEFDFLNGLEDEEAKKKKEVAEQEEEELKRFRLSVQIKSARGPPQPITSGSSSFTISPHTQSTTTTSATKKKPLFAGLVKRKDEDDKNSTSTSPAIETKVVGDKRKAESQSQSSTTSSKPTSINGSDSKRSKVDNALPSKSKPNALLSLAAYGSDSDEDD